MTADDEASLRFSGGPRALQCICFVRMKDVRLGYAMSEADLLVSRPDCEYSVAALSAFAKAMLKKERVMLARYVRITNAEPHIVALWPAGGVSNYYFICQQLPFKQDVRIWRFPTLRSALAGSGPSSAAKRLLQMVQQQVIAQRTHPLP